MAIATFDTLKFANTLKAAGVPDKQAEAQAAILNEAFEANFKELVTKDDLKATKEELDQRLCSKIDTLAARVDGHVTLIKWMVGLSISLNVAVLVRLFFARVP